MEMTIPTGTPAAENLPGRPKSQNIVTTKAQAPPSNTTFAIRVEAYLNENLPGRSTENI